MRNRTPLYFLVGFLLAAVLVCASTNVAAGNKHNSNAWIIAQEKTPLLWMVDGCALIILMGSWLLGVAINSLQNEAVSQTDDNSRHIAVLTETVQDLFRQNNEYASRLEALEQTGDAWHDGFEEEARRLTEQAFLALSDNIETNTLQLESVILALRYQRAEMQAVRSAFKTGEIAPPIGSPPTLEIVDRQMKPFLTEWRKPQNEIEASETLDSDTVEIHEAVEAVEVTESEAMIDMPHVTEDEDLTTPHESDDSEDGISALDSDLNVEFDLTDENADNVETFAEPSLAADRTMNASTAVVETLEFDASLIAAVVGSREVRESASKTGLAADEFRRSKRDPQSIFRQKRR